MKTFILALDQGTTSSRAIIFDRHGKAISSAHKEFRQIFPRPGWVEHDPVEIWESQKEVALRAVRKAGLKSGQIESIGITNQRETTILWDRKTGNPVHNAIVWQCRRTADICKALYADGKGEVIRDKTGLILDAYFSATKIKWILDRMPGLRARAERGEICFGTVDSWLLFNLTGKHFTDVTNASRTMLFNILTGKWDNELLNIFGVPEKILPEVKPSSGFFANTRKEIFGFEIPVGGVAGDQQASLFGQACFSSFSAKNTYGTGCFMLVNTGRKPVFSENRVLTTIAWDIGDGMEYALEGSVFTGGAVIKWLRDSLKILKVAADSEKMAKQVSDTGGVYFVPAFSGLGAPYWAPEVRGSIFGITGGTTPEHIARAALESIAFQSRDLIGCIQGDIGRKIKSLKVDGGASVNNFLMQYQADILGIPVVRSAVPETTALGAAYFAGLSCGYWESKKDIEKNWRSDSIFKPSISSYERESRMTMWKKAVKTASEFV